LRNASTVVSPQYPAAISEATGSPYTHAAIYLGDGFISESIVPNGVVISDVKRLLHGSHCVAVLRSQCGFDGARPGRLKEFVASVLKQHRLYDFSAVLNFGRESKAYFEKQLEFVRENYGKAATTEEFAARSFFCSALVVACYSAVGIIDESAQVAYPPEFFSPGHLCEDPTFGWLLGYLIPEGGSLPSDDPLLANATLWRDNQEARWW
jgi:hypothetical protein